MKSPLSYFSTLIARAFIACCCWLPIVAQAQVRITEVTLSTRNVEITNFGASSVNLGNWYFCHSFIYQNLGGTIAAGASRQFTVNNLNQSATDLGLYLSGNFGTPADMEDFLQWGSGGIGRESVAVAKGIWSTSAPRFLIVPAAGVSLHAKGNPAAGVRNGNWFTAFPHVGFPLPPLEIKSSVIVAGQWSVKVNSYYLLASHRVDTSSDLGATPWVTSVPTSVTDLGGRQLELKFPASGPRQFARVKVP